MRNYTVDIGSLSITAHNEEEAAEEALKMMRQGWAEIDQVIDMGEAEDEAEDEEDDALTS